MDCCLPGSFVRGIFSGNTGVGCHFLSRESSWLRDWTHISCIAGDLCCRRILYQLSHWRIIYIFLVFVKYQWNWLGFPGSTSGKEPACQCRRHKRWDSVLGLGRSPGGGNGDPLQYSCLEMRSLMMLQFIGSQKAQLLEDLSFHWVEIWFSSHFQLLLLLLLLQLIKNKSQVGYHFISSCLL